MQMIVYRANMATVDSRIIITEVEYKIFIAGKVMIL